MATKPRNARKNRCSVCKQVGHIKRTCPQVIGEEMASKPYWRRCMDRNVEKGRCSRCGGKNNSRSQICDRCYERRHGKKRMTTGREPMPKGAVQFMVHLPGSQARKIRSEARRRRIPYGIVIRELIAQALGE